MSARYRFLVVAFLILFSLYRSNHQAFAQEIEDPDFAWTRQLGIEGRAVTRDGVGNLYVTGRCEEGFFIMKFDASGNMLWENTPTCTGRAFGHSVTTDESDNIYVTGEFTETLAFGSIQMTSNGEIDLFIVKYDSSGDLKWAKQAGGTGSDVGEGIASDRSGGLYVTGGFMSNLSFDAFELTTIEGYYDIFVVKYDYSGNAVWAKAVSGQANNKGMGIASDALGHVYVTGYYAFWADFDGSELNSNGWYDMFLAKVDASGMIVWVKTGGGGDWDHGYGVAVDGSGNVCVTGDFDEEATFNSTEITGAGDKDIFTVKYDGSGNVLWAKSAGGTGDDYGYGIAIDNSGNTYVTGYYEDELNIDSYHLTSQGDRDIFIGKYNDSGEFLWAKSAGGSEEDIGYGITADASENCYTTGYFEHPAFFGSYATEDSDDLGFLTKIGSDTPQPPAEEPPDFVWANSIGDDKGDFCGDIDVDENGNSVVTGGFYSSSSFGNITLNSNGGRDIYIAKYDDSGQVSWAQSAGGSADEEGVAVALGPAGTIYLTGYFYETLQIGNSTLASNGDCDVFVAKYDESGSPLWANSLGGVKEDRGYGIDVDAYGNCVITGSYRETAYAEATVLTGDNTEEIFVVKYDASGTMLWARQASGPDLDRGMDIALDGQGSCYVTGLFMSSATFNGTNLNMNTNLPPDIFIAKYNDSGDLTWVKSIGGEHAKMAFGIDLDYAGNILITGQIQKPVTIGAATIFRGDIYTAKYNNEGNVLWADESQGNECDAWAYRITVDGSGNSYVCGWVDGPKQLGQNALTSVGNDDIFVVKYDPSGNILWTKQAGGIDRDIAVGIGLDASDNCYIAGQYDQTVQFDEISLPEMGNQDVFVAKLGDAGTEPPPDPTKPLDFAWAFGAGDDQDQEVYALVTDAEGNSVLTGSFLGTMTLGGTTLVAEDEDIFLARFDNNGNPLWAKRAGSVWDDIGQGVTLAPSGNILVTGYIGGTAQFDHITLEPNQSRDIFIAEYNTMGELQWAEQYGGDDSEYGYDIAVGSQGDIAIIGSIYGNASTIGNFTFDADYSDVLIAKLDGTGDVLWAKKAGGPDLDRGCAIACDASGNIAVSGVFFDTIEFDGITLTSEGLGDLFIAKYDTYGNFLWAERMGTFANWETGEDVTFDHDGNVIVTGNIFFYNDDVILAKYDPDGNQLWFWNDGGTGLNIGYSVTLNPQNHIFITGYISGTGTFGTTSISPVGLSDFFVSRFDQDGNFLWVQHAGSDKMEEGQAVALDEFGNCYIAGNYEGPFSLGTTNLTCAGGSDIFLTRMGTFTGVEDDCIISRVPYAFRMGNNYPNPFNSTTTIEFQLPKSTTVNVSIYNINGQQITTLVDQWLEAGIHEVKWDAQNANSGLYFYFILADGQKLARKCMLIK